MTFFILLRYPADAVSYSKAAAVKQSEAQKDTELKFRLNVIRQCRKEEDNCLQKY